MSKETNILKIESLIQSIITNSYPDYDAIVAMLKLTIAKTPLDTIKKQLSEEYIKYLLDIAKESYYNTKIEVIDDATYDDLEEFVGLENKNYVGSKSSAKHANYTVKHSFIMGSLSKVQIKEDKKTGTIDWDKFASEINRYISRASGCRFIEVTPKLDGASFSCEFNHRGQLISAGTRGDGEYGSDISVWLKDNIQTNPNWNEIKHCCANVLDEDDILVIRGEVLVPQSSFAEKFSNDFKNPRSYVAGRLGLKKSEVSESDLKRSDLHYVCYDYRIVDGKTGTFTELDWMNPFDKTYKILGPYLGHIGELPEEDFCVTYKYNGNFTGEELQEIYEKFSDFRKNNSEYALDGIVFKPEASARIYNEDRTRPLDCVAMKFTPMVNATEIIDIEWNVKKTGEYFPKAIIKPIYLDGKEIRKASLHNYNYIVTNKCGIGSSVIISLAGDIIPYIHEVVYAAGSDNINLPEDSEVINGHLMKVFEDDSAVEKNQFIASANALNINTIGPAAASALWNNLHNDIDGLCNIVYLMSDENLSLIYERMGKTKSVSNIVNNLKEYRNHIMLEDIILSFCFKSCGNRASALCAKIIRGEEHSTASTSSVAYKWAYDTNSEEYNKVMDVVNMLGIDITSEDNDVAESGKIPIIMTGSPKPFGYATKKEFLNAHPEYEDTTDWKACKILFTDDLESTSGKMKKAQKLGIDIKTYF